ncbi:MAG TPA: radical SAM protein [Candidatus Hydrogenedentes bacterium]|nr:radical SAM protein [Candidatus Hydrogenedentota bacterium]
MTPETATVGTPATADATPEARPATFNGGNWKNLGLEKTQKRVLTKRAVMWLGQTCNLRCYFCYFLNRIDDAHHPEHPFMDIQKAKDMCTILREFYGCTSIDIQGGEPTIYPHILELIRHCHDIGLYPTLITNGLHLAKPGNLEKFRDAGVRDFLCSLHGIGDIHDEVVCKKGAYEKITTAIGRMQEIGIPFRFNCTMSKPVVPILPQIAQKAIDYGANAVNYLAFNPFEDQETGIRTHDNVAKYTDIKPYLTQAMDMLEEADIECNVRYLPICMAEDRHKKNFYNFQQLSYDHHEWDYQSWMWTGLQPQRMKEGGLVPAFRIGMRDRQIMGMAHKMRDFAVDRPTVARFVFGAQHVVARIEQAVRGNEEMYREEAMIRAKYDAGYRYHEACEKCAARRICDGFHGDYADLFGTAEATPIQGAPIDDPKHFIKEQRKVVEREDEAWAL